VLSSNIVRRQPLHHHGHREQVEIPEGCYPGEYLIEVAKKVLEKFGKNCFEKETEVKLFVIEEMMKNIKTDLARLKVNQDVFTSDQKMIDTGEVEKAIKILEQKGLVYKGVLPQPKGKLTDEWEER
jgi:arginyl-tRNA synthetase